MKTNIATKILDDVVLVYNNEENPSEEEWPGYITLQSKLKLPVLVVTDGGAPNAKQRSEINTHFVGRKVAVLTDSKVALAVLTALFWFNKSMRGFAAEEYEPALRYLGTRLSPDLARKQIEGLRTDVKLANRPS